MRDFERGIGREALGQVGGSHPIVNGGNLILHEKRGGNRETGGSREEGKWMSCQRKGWDWMGHGRNRTDRSATMQIFDDKMSRAITGALYCVWRAALVT